MSAADISRVFQLYALQRAARERGDEAEWIELAKKALRILPPEHQAIAESAAGRLDWVNPILTPAERIDRQVITLHNQHAVAMQRGNHAHAARLRFQIARLWRMPGSPRSRSTAREGRSTRRIGTRSARSSGSSSDPSEPEPPLPRRRVADRSAR